MTFFHLFRLQRSMYAHFAAGFCMLLLLSSCATTSDPVRLEHTVIISEETYKKAEKLLSWNVSEHILHHNVRPHWIDDDRFWYRVRTEGGHRFYLVDPEQASRQPAFDHEKMAATLDTLFEQRVKATRLPFRSFEFVDDETRIRFTAEEKTWECTLSHYTCTETDRVRPPENSVLSPDGRYAAFIDSHNLWIRDLETEEEFALTTTGTKGHGFAANSQGWFRSDRPVLNWSPDSRKIATYRLDEREVKPMHLLETAEDRPLLMSWPYALPGDTIVPKLERVILDIDERKKIWLDIEPSHQRTSNCCGLERDGAWTDHQWSPDGSTLAFVTTSRDYRQVDLYIANTRTGDVRHIYRENAKTFFESNLSSRGHPNWRVLFDRDEFIWFTRKDEWGHLYLHSLMDGQPIKRITEGNWNVIDVHHVDPKRAQVWFTAVGVDPEVDPYHEYLYKTGFEGVITGTPELISTATGHHRIHMSPSGRFIVDEFSAFSQPSETVLLNRKGQTIKELETSDIQALLEAGWTAPESFTAKARDGETDLYGIMIKPESFDPGKTYPVIINIYPGPQVGSVGSRSFMAARRGEVHALAALGFVVIQLDALGTPFRSKSFHTAWYGDMSDNGIEDQIAALRQLGDQYSWLDIGRTGIYGHSGGGYATMSALLNHPGVFSAGVASAGNMDNRGYTYYWGEKYQGLRKIENGYDSYRNQVLARKASALQDPLLLTYGTMDSNVHPNSTLLLIDALIEENRDFDLIVFPNRGHGYASEPYHLRRTFDFFVKHLLNAVPPAGVQFE
ncbi:DPP IV N-terminal domain-containing protein [Balneolaceae bacterium ANBcel3]|nr:DPP IV N-terminal domain-containing protein [Balneolaceae bacterium ANBcel3]